MIKKTLVKLVQTFDEQNVFKITVPETVQLYGRLLF